MRNRHLPVLIAVVFFCLFLSLLPALAKSHGQGREGRKAFLKQQKRAHRNNQVVVYQRERVRPRRDNRVVIVVPDDDDRFDRDGRPPGWDRGRKVGWGNCDVPPGLAKKVGCRDGVLTRRVIYRPRRTRDVVIWVPFVGAVRIPYNY